MNAATLQTRDGSLPIDASRRLAGRGQAWRRPCLAAFIGCLLASTACTTRSKDGTMRRHYFGYAVVSIPTSTPAAPRITASEIRSYGLALGGGATVLGYGQEHHVALPPDGRMYMVVHTDEQFEQARKLIENHPDLGLCVTKNTPP